MLFSLSSLFAVIIAVCIGSITAAAVLLGDWRRCLANIDAMVAHGVPLDQRSVHAALYSCGRTGTMTTLLLYYGSTISTATCADDVTVTTDCSPKPNASWLIIEAALNCCIAYVVVLCLAHTLF
jgi:hypothetical protein